MTQRTWHAGKPKKKPDYDPQKASAELTAAAADIYQNTKDGRHPTLKAIAEQLCGQGYRSFSQVKIRKLLITAGVYQSDTADRVLRLRQEGRSIPEIMELLNLSKAAVNANLPYERTAYKLDEAKNGDIAIETARQHLFKRRRNALKALAESMSGQKAPHYDPAAEEQARLEIHARLWDAVIAFEGDSFTTSKGLTFTYEVKKNKHGAYGNELIISRKEKTVTRATVDTALDRVLDMGDGTLPVIVNGPKQIGTFGASYLYPIFVRFGVAAKGK